MNTSDNAFQANYLQNVYQLASGEYAGRVPVVFWFCWSDAMVPPFGMLNASGAAKDAYYRYQWLAGSW